LTGEPILPARTANQYLSMINRLTGEAILRRDPRTNIWPDIGSRFAPVKLVGQAIYQDRQKDREREREIEREREER
jgi:hypothetical protein